jgi:Zn finger protein HypA/HybF involved in hydrogenase expression
MEVQFMRLKHPFHFLTQQEIQYLFDTFPTKKDILAHYGYKQLGYYYKILTALVKKYDIDLTKHKILSLNNYRDKSKRPSKGKIPNELWFSENVKRSNYNTKKRLLKEFNFVNECSECKGKPFHNGKPLSLQVDHIDGNNLNNSLSNLRLLCPNCHSQTITFGSKNIKKSFKRVVVKLPKFPKPLKVKKEKIRCTTCGHYRAEKECKHCKNNRKPKIEKEYLQHLVNTNPMTTVGKIIGMTDNGIRKMCKRLHVDLPNYPTGYWLRKKQNKELTDSLK